MKDIEVTIDQQKMEADKLPPFLSAEFKNIILQGSVDAITAKVVYDGFETDLMQEESTGIKKLFGLLCPLLDIIVNRKVLLCDETGLLNLDLFRRDQIWFTEMKKEDRSTELYSLAEIRNIRKDDNFGKGYISGRYGAIPMLNIDFANIVSKM